MTDSTHKEVGDIFVEEQIKHAEAGDRDQALAILKHFQKRIEMGWEPDHRYLEYLARCFEKITEHGQSAHEALNLKPKGRPKENHKYRDLQMAEKVILKRRSGEKREMAFLEVACETGLSVKTVEFAYDKYKQVAEQTLALDPIAREPLTAEFLRVRKKTKKP